MSISLGCPFYLPVTQLCPISTQPPARYLVPTHHAAAARLHAAPAQHQPPGHHSGPARDHHPPNYHPPAHHPGPHTAPSVILLLPAIQLLHTISSYPPSPSCPRFSSCLISSSCPE